ncbi:hypothetical protein LCGC14_1410850 [marine sediment metagenome]|uniref:Uncharacterized protein n=1 Tax=marine sediment metagenome TaxID=412755 RepID=A0A0F9KFD4_9ZZZZ
MVKQIPKDTNFGSYGSGENGQATLVDWLDKHAEEWRPPTGDIHLHLMYARVLHWRVVERGSSVCKVPGRCYLMTVHERGPEVLCQLVRRPTDVQS